MAITAMGLGTKAAPDNVNLDPQRQFWSWLTPFMSPSDRTADSYHHQRAYFSGFACTQTTPAGMTIQIGGTAEADSAVLFIADGDKTKAVLLSTDGEPEVVTIPTAPASGSRIDAVVSYIDTTSADPEGETPGTPEYVKTIVVSGTAASSPSAPTDSQIVAALPAGANSRYYRWCDVKVAASQTVITNSNITDKKPTPPNVYLTTSETEVELQDGVTANFTRMGNIVICAIVGTFASSTPLGLVYNGVVPNGYRPKDNNRLAPWVDSYNHIGRFGPYANANFVVYGASGEVVQGTIVGVTSYITNDPMPS